MAGGEPSTDEQIDRLFALPASEFTAARDRLARDLRGAGDRATAAEVKQLRRPTTAAWALNRLVRHHPDAVTELLDAGRQLQEAQRTAVSGGGAGPLREAQQRRRAAVTDLADRAATLLREQGGAAETHLSAIRSALEAASVDEAVASELRQARLTQPPQRPSGLGLEAFVPAGDGAPPGRDVTAPARETADTRDDLEPQETASASEHSRADETPEAERAEAERAAARLAAAERAADAAAAAAQDRRREADGAAQVAADAAAEVDQLSRDLEAARAHARLARDRAEKAEADARKAESAVHRRERERIEARSEVERQEQR